MHLLKKNCYFKLRT